MKNKKTRMKMRKGPRTGLKPNTKDALRQPVFKGIREDVVR